MKYFDLPHLVIAVVVTGICLAQNAPTNDSPAAGSLAWHAAKARNEGKSSVTLGPTIPLYAELESLDDAIQHNAVVIATLLQSETVHDDRTISTWRKYRTDETLTGQARTFPEDRDKQLQKLIATAPKSLLPLRSGEFLMYEDGGTATIDGVQITNPAEGTDVVQPGSRHVMFLIFGGSGRLAAAAYGPRRSQFGVDASGMLHTRVASPGADKNQLLQEIRSRTDGSLSAFRSLAVSEAPVR